MRALYPEIEPFNSFQLQADELHCLYVEECGNPSGLPVIFLHGGPGSGCNENHRRYFNPETYRIVIFDQRGTGRSTPPGCVEKNTTQMLIADIEAIREKLGINKWVVFGGSWGATLGLLYAESHPAVVMGLILRGTFLARKVDMDWFAGTGTVKIFPDYWQDFLQPIPEEERDDLILAYYRRLQGDNEKDKIAAARAWSNWAGRLVTYLLPEISLDGEETNERIVHEVSIEVHYAKHDFFIEEDQILSRVDTLHGIPTRIIHGRRDLTCTVDASWALHQALPGSELFIIRDGGHLASQPVMTDALIKATDAMAAELK